MKILIPTAKELNLLSQTSPHQLSQKSQKIVDTILNHRSIEDLAVFYKISKEKAQEEYLRLRQLQTEQALAAPALDLFNGLMYRNIDRNLSETEKNYVKKRVFITSALYGISNAYDAMAAHRLDFTQTLSINGKSLKNYWQKDYDRFLEKQGPFISLLSSEFELVFSKKYREQLIQVQFMENKNGQLKTHATISKKARGKCLSQMIKQDITQVSQLKALTFDGFVYDASLSSPQKLVFIKKV